MQTRCLVSRRKGSVSHRRFSLIRLAVFVLLVQEGASCVHAQLSVGISPDEIANVPGNLSKFNIDYRWASTTQSLSNARIEISLADSPLDNDASSDVVLGPTAHIRTSSFSTSTKKATFTFINPLPAGSSGTLTLQTRFRADGTITNGLTRPITAVFSATNLPSVSDTAYLTASGIMAGTSITKTRLGYNSTTNEVIAYEIKVTVPSTNLDLTAMALTDQLPPRSTFVGASASGAYSVLSNTVTWPVQAFEAGSTSTYTVQLACASSNGFVGGTSSTGSAVTNVAEVVCTPLYGETFVRVVTNVYRLLTAAATYDTQLKQDAGFNGLYGDLFTWEVKIRNRSSAQADAVSIDDAYPPAFIPTAFSPGYAGVSPTTVWMYYRTKLNTAWQSMTNSPISVTSLVEATNRLVLVSSLGLAESDVVTDCRWVYTNFNVIATLNGTATIGPMTSGYIAPTDRNGVSVAADAVVTNTATITMSRKGAADVVRTVSDTVTNAQPRAYIDLSKSVSGSAYPGTTNTWTLNVGNTSNASTNLFDPVIADLLPASLEYVTNSFSRSGAGFTGMTATAMANYKGTGRTLLRIALQGSQEIGKTATISFKTVVRFGTGGGTIQNTVSLLGCENGTYLTVDGAVSDAYDLDNDGNTTETFATASGTLTVNTTAAVNSYKAIQGYPDTAFYMQPQEGASYLGGPISYRLRIQNVGNATLTNIVLVDVLPYVGDSGVIVTNEQRGSQWTPFLTGSVSGPAGVTVYYSQSHNPSRPELLEGDATGATNDWSSVAPDDIRTVKSIKFAFNDTALAPADTVELTWPMQIPLGAPTNTYAVNSFGFVATRQDTGENLLPTEPLSVRIKAGPPQPVNIGDRVWDDANTNGVQDVGEAGLDGVRVELYRDGGDGQAGSADDTFVTFVLTGVNTNGASGFYQFSHQPPGDYFVRVIPATGYSLTSAEEGADDAADSDVSATSGYTALLRTFSGDRIWTVDAGLYFTGYGTIGNYVWNDRNADGLQNEGSADGLNGVRVELYAVGDNSSNLVAAQTSAYDSFGKPGYFRFDYITPSNYVLRFVAPSNFTFTARGSTGASDATDSDPDSDGYTETFTVAMGSSDLTWDAGLHPPSGALSLGNMVWFDADGDRVFDRYAGEGGINGVPLSLYRDVDADNVLTEGVDPLYGSTVTATLGGEDGRYLFSGLPAGSYFVTVDRAAFDEGKILHDMISTPGRQDADSDVDHDDNGAAISNRVVSARITLAVGTEPAYGADSGEDANTDSNLTLDFGFLYATNLVAVGGSLFLDADLDGVQSASEAVLDGLSVQLWSAGANGERGGGDDSLTASTLSDGDGAYLFIDLAPGAYYVVVPVPPESATSATVLAVATDDGEDADSNALQPGGPGTAVYSGVFRLVPLGEPAGASESGPNGDDDDALACGDSNADLTQDLGFAALEPIWTIRGHVRDDYDLDGSFADSDMPVAGVTVQLYSDPDGDGSVADGALLRATSTLADGTYAITGLPNGRYVVVETDPDGSFSTADTAGLNDNRIPVMVNNADSAGHDFLDAFQPQGYFYHVLDGALVPGGSVSISGPGVVTLHMDGSSGQYSFTTDGTSGTYTLTVTPPPGYLVDPSRPVAGTLFGAGSGPAPVVLGAAESTTDPGFLADFSAESNAYYRALALGAAGPVVLNNNIPLMRPNRLGDRVWHDVDGDGAQDDGEPGISNVTVRLLDADQNILTSVVSDVQGHYAFDNPGTAPRLVQVLAPSPYTFTAQDAVDGDDAADSDMATSTGCSEPLAVASGGTNVTLDVGLYVPALLHGYLFKDKNGDSLRNTLDSAITGATVRLVQHGAVTAVAKSSELGYYRFDSVAPGSVSILVSRVTSTLVSVPTAAPASVDERRSRALPDADGFDAFIVQQVVSGLGVLAEEPSETLNFGFVETSLSSAISIGAYATVGGVIVVDVSTVDEAGYGDIVVYAWIDGRWTEVARIPSGQVLGTGSNHYTALATGLVEGASYWLKVVDEVGHAHISPGLVDVKAFRIRAVRLEMDAITVVFDTEEGCAYQIVVKESLGGQGSEWAPEVASIKRAGGWTAFSALPFVAEGTQTTVRVPTGRARAFAKIVKVE